jgi:hypothetical protein
MRPDLKRSDEHEQLVILTMRALLRKGLDRIASAQPGCGLAFLFDDAGFFDKQLWRHRL